MFIIFTIGRTGSSLLVNILNQYKEVTVAGEIYKLDLFSCLNRGDKDISINKFQIFNDNNNKIKGRLPSSSIYFPKNTNYHKYYNKPEKFKEEFDKLKTNKERLEYIMPQNKIVGCKILANSKNLKWFLGFENIIKHFKIILLVREDIKDLEDSMKRAGFITSKSKKIDLQKENDEYKKIYEENRERMYYLTYDDIINISERYVGLYNFIGMEHNKNNTIVGLNTICSYASSLSF